MGVIGTSGSADGDGEDAWDERISLAPLMATLLLPILIGAIVVIKCVFGHCCVRKTTTKEEMYGVEGRMTMLINSDATYLAIPSASASFNTQGVRTSRPTSMIATTTTEKPKLEGSKSANKAKLQNNNNNSDPTTITVVNEFGPLSKSSEFPLFHRSECDLTDSLKRMTGKRQLPDLPDLPLQSLGHPRRSSSVLSHDGTSELYATVGEVPNPPPGSSLVNPYAHLKSRHSVPNDICLPSTSRGPGIRTDSSKKRVVEPNPSSDSETYASSNHPYAKLKKTEHPYARVRNANVANDEETDTDNYDLPQPYAQSQRTPGGGAGQSVSNSGVSSSHQGPVPPRRLPRQSRRPGPQQQNSMDSTTHFSGDSQDSRGYTSISVREPLENIRSQVPRGRTGDSHYATVSDDSEEMYAAIDDSSAEGNYMQINEEERGNRPSWLDAANVASPIPERREANSPLPPVPAVPPPNDISSTAPPLSPVLTIPPQTPPVYAQVTKKSKKNKAPVTPTTSNASISSQTFGKEQLLSDNPIPGPSSIITSSTSNPSQQHSHSHHRHHRSKSRTLMDNSNLLESNISEHRRWSKADISYSEFEIVREPSIPINGDVNKSPIALSLSSERQHGPVSPRDSIESRHAAIPQEIVDEDNYNLIPDKIDGRGSSRGRNSSGRTRMDSDNYQEIEPISNTYQEIGGNKEPSDHYQEIGAGLSSATANGRGTEDDNDNGSGLYQEIRKNDIDDYEEEEEDQFYEKVRPSTQTLSVPAQSLSTGRKHGYEKIKRKVKPPSPNRKEKAAPASDEDDEEDEEGRAEEDLMYEKVKYPPYERLKESRSDLAVNVSLDDEDEGNNFYEHIGYSRVKPKNKASNSSPCRETVRDESEIQQEETTIVDMNQLYAVVDKSKKKSKISSSSNNASSTNNNNPQNYNNNNSFVASNLSSSSALPNNSSSRFSSPGRSSNNHKIVKGLSVHTEPELDFIDSNDIEYI